VSMCSLCGALGQGPAWEQGGIEGDEARWRLRQEATAAAAEVTRLLAPRRIKVSASPHLGFVVAFPTGRTETAASLAEIWHLLARSKVEIPDPLAA
jgi:hypothetical protein